jgi:EAL domain-containing protein (putative c-di-GMP-specific phosphodiesterase class I)
MIRAMRSIPACDSALRPTSSVNTPRVRVNVSQGLHEQRRILSRLRSSSKGGIGRQPLLSDRTAPTWEHLRNGLRIQPVFQPIISLTHGKAAAYEALSRPSLEDGGVLSVVDVVDSARSLGPEAEAEFDAHAIQAIAQRAAELPAGVMLFVNVSPATPLDHPEVLQPLENLSAQVVLEITERSTVPHFREPEFTRAMDLLRWRGFLLAMDDCGAGYSGLNRLVALKPEFAKVDMELVRGVDHDSAKAQLVEALVAFARRAGISVIAEGVETEAELATLTEVGVGYVQGYLLGRPAADVLPAAIPPRLKIPPAVVDASSALGAHIRLAHMASRGLGDALGLYEAIVHTAREATQADLVVLRRRVGQDLTPVATSGVPDTPRTVRLSSSDPVAAAFNASRVIIRQTRYDSSQEQPYGSAVGAPISVQGWGWGMLSLFFREENRVRGDLVDLATGFADQTGLMIAANQGGILPNRTDTIDALRFRITHPGDHSDFFARIIRDVEQATGSHDCWIGAIQDDRFDIVMGNGEVTETPLAHWLDAQHEMGKMPPGVALREGRRVVVDDIREDPSLEPQLQDLLAMAIISAAAIPITHEGAVLGILKAYHSTVAAFAEEQLAFLEEVASLLGAMLVTSPGQSS